MKMKVGYSTVRVYSTYSTTVYSCGRVVELVDWISLIYCIFFSLIVCREHFEVWLMLPRSVSMENWLHQSSTPLRAAISSVLSQWYKMFHLLDEGVQKKGQRNASRVDEWGSNNPFLKVRNPHYSQGSHSPIHTFDARLADLLNGSLDLHDED